MASQVDASIPMDGSKADKGEFRANFQTIKDEITELQAGTELASELAFSFDGEMNL